MGSRIDKRSWAVIQIVIRRYPEQKEEYENLILELNGSRGKANDGQPKGSGVGNPVESMVLNKVEKLASPHAKRLEREVAAVSKIYDKLPEEHKKVVRIRFWSNRYKNVQYLHMQRCVSYSERQMKRICAQFIKSVGEELGEL